MTDETVSEKAMHFKPDITLGTIVILLGMLISVGTIIWQASGIAATVQANVDAQRVLLEMQNKSIHAEIGDVKSDVRELRTIILTRADPAKGK